jgi:hypothetical protein
VVAAGTCATYGGIHAMQNNPTGCMGLADYLGWDWRSKAGLPIVNVPGCPVQPDNFMETLLYLLYQVAGLAPMIPLDDQLRPKWLFERTVHEGCDPSAAGWAALVDARTSAASASVARCLVFRTSSCPSWMNRPEPASRHCPRPWWAAPLPPCEELRTTPSIKNPSGGTRGARSRPGTRLPIDTAPSGLGDSGGRLAQRLKSALSFKTENKTANRTLLLSGQSKGAHHDGDDRSSQE